MNESTNSTIMDVVMHLTSEQEDPDWIGGNLELESYPDLLSCAALCSIAGRRVAGA